MSASEFDSASVSNFNAPARVGQHHRDLSAGHRMCEHYPSEDLTELKYDLAQLRQVGYKRHEVMLSELDDLKDRLRQHQLSLRRDLMQVNQRLDELLELLVHDDELHE